jgi:hypothetical protein
MQRCSRTVAFNWSVLTFTTTLLIDSPHQLYQMPLINVNTWQTHRSPHAMMLHAASSLIECWNSQIANEPYFTPSVESQESGVVVWRTGVLPLVLTFRILTESGQVIPNFSSFWSIIKSPIHVRISLSMYLVNRLSYFAEYSVPGFPLNVLIHSEA